MHDQIEHLKSAGDNLARYARSLRLSVTAHPNYTGEPNAEWTDLVEGVDNALAEWKGEKKLTPEEIEERKQAIEWYRNPAGGQGAVWVKGVKGFPIRKKVIAKFKHYDDPLRDWIVGGASSSTGEMITFDWYVSSITLDINHERWTMLEWLDESAG